MLCKRTVSSFLLALIGCVLVIPKEATGDDPPPIIGIKDGLLGVNLFGFHAAAGLNGLGLHAEAATPFGQGASAGLGAVFKEDGSIGGNLYSGATAGGDLRSSASIGGSMKPGLVPSFKGNYMAAAMAGPMSTGISAVGDTETFSVVTQRVTPPPPVMLYDKGNQSPEGSSMDKVFVSVTSGTPVENYVNEVATLRPRVDWRSYVAYHIRNSQPNIDVLKLISNLLKPPPPPPPADPPTD